MEITKTARFITDFLGTAPAIGNATVLQRYLEEKVDKSLLTFAEKELKKGQTAADKISEILSVFHRDAEGNPVLGSWMLRRCLVVTGQTVFNAMKNKDHPKRDMIPMAIQLVEPSPHIAIVPHAMGLNSILNQPYGVHTFTISLQKQRRSFFKAYEYIKAGCTFEFTVTMDDELITEEQAEYLLRKAGQIGVGAFRERFGKFDYV